MPTEVRATSRTLIPSETRVPITRSTVSRVAVVGLGYVGLPAASAFARAGYSVIGVDISTRVVDAIRSGSSPLAEAVEHATIAELVRDGRLRATTSASEAVRDAEFVTVCVPTPVDEKRKPDLGPLESASRAIGAGLHEGVVVSFESTTFPGCTERVCIPLLEEASGLRAGRDFGVAYCPERVVPGDAAHTTLTMPRVLGGLDARSFEIAHEVYSRALGTPIHGVRDLRTAEASKVFENVQRDVNLALVNEFALLAPHLGLDAHAVLEAARTKFNFVDVRPGPGVGGHCIPVDPYYLIEEARRVGFDARLMAFARKVNDETTEQVVEAVVRDVAGRTDPARAKAAILGLAYKGGVGDLRESPALHVYAGLASQLGSVAAHDPRAPASAVAAATGASPATLDEALRGAHAVVLLTDHPEFAHLSWSRVASLASPGAVVFDTRNLAFEEDVRAAGLGYWGLGRTKA